MFFEDDENLNISINNESNIENNNTQYFDFGNGEQENSTEDINQSTILTENNNQIPEQNNQETQTNNNENTSNKQDIFDNNSDDSDDSNELQVVLGDDSNLEISIVGDLENDLKPRVQKRGNIVIPKPKIINKEPQNNQSNIDNTNNTESNNQ
jgi:hypothetical protein